MKNGLKKIFIIILCVFSISVFTVNMTEVYATDENIEDTEEKETTYDYTITYKLNGGKNNQSNPEGYNKGKTIKLKNPTRVGYTFKGWYKDSKYKTKVTSVKNKNITLYAKWSVNTYNIKFSGNGSTSGKMSSKTKIKYNKNYTLKSNAFKKKGYTFIGWNTKKDGSGTSYKNKESIKNLSSKNKKTVTLYAQWKKKTYTITYKLNKGTNNSSNPSEYNVKTATITLKNPKRDGYTFKGWYSDSKYTKKVTTIKKGSTGNKTLYAKWVVNSFKKNINSVKLNPMITRYSDLDKKIENIINKKTNSSMTNYEKLNAVYHYVINYLSYGGGVINLSDPLFADISKNKYATEDAFKIYLALSSLNSKKGVCDNYAALFMILSRRLGFESYVVNGYIRLASSGKQSGHAWVMLKAGNTYYVFDPEAEDEYKVKNHYFGKTTKERNAYTFDLNGNIKLFHNFEEMKPITSSLKISGAIEYSKSFTTSERIKEESDKYTVKVGDTIDISANIDGNGTYKNWITLQNRHDITDDKYIVNGVLDKSINTSYTFDTPGDYYLYVETRDTTFGVNVLYYIYITVVE